MRSKIAPVLVGAAFLLAGAPLALAKAVEHQFWGQVSSLDTAAKTLDVKQSGSTAREMTFKVAPEAKVTQGTKARTFAELKVGERVKVSYIDEGASHEAKRIDVLPARSAKAESSPMAGTQHKTGY